ncbi:MAG: hypothetical protein A3F84_19235 [Candidatus Handelsmanbacteria bacterium RIFCSPLOWO2_12_FULL_64_10]|uniref:Beta-hexosaminidase bacterial type N-terminal domain-containing protein n=1 Tax=Handelsmanbacteria sp. (strain RIFCSPLOWO2_12_FULL_64_10) TaxID=1817868 RepID=A0A1F6CUZ4_HANXR|nr:MAG: hypothetical protein A3F84_19235 [Candidatus Handelsmanbacteria bacterium RIFCSPLOWO2_12_FULL_64_10]
MASKTLTLSDRGEIKTALVLPDGAGEVLREAAADLQSVLEKMTGVAPPMGSDDGKLAPSGRTAIHVGRTACARSLNLDAGDVGVEGYRITTSGRDLFILGGSDSGTSYGVYGLLEDHLGVRWFMPGELFEDVPVQTTLRIAPIHEEVRPHFLHRVFSGIFSLEGAAWERRNRVSRRRPELPYAGFHHALYRIFPVARYGKTHPEYYALIDGQRLIPESDGVSNARFGQPCTSNPEVVEITVQAARSYFDEHPEAHCFSLGMNDNRNFCLCEGCRALDVPGLVFRDRPVYSDRWFTYVNAVAKALQATHPGKFVGCLAYINVESPPQRIARLEPNVAIYLTQDTPQHLDPAYRDKDREFILSWVKKCDHVCKYDYYGLGWMLPRYCPHLIADDIRFQHSAGVRGFYAEAYPHWASFGPHVYLASKLWWNADRDAERLLSEFFERLFRGAAGEMRAFYDKMEEVWMRPREGRWFQGLRGLHDQIPCYTVEDVDALEALLGRAYRASRDPLVRLRIDYVRRWFPFPATLVRGWRWADEVLALPPGPAAQEKAQALRRLPARLSRAFRQAVLEDRLMPKRAYFSDGRYQARVEAPWKEKVEKAIAHAQG